MEREHTIHLASNREKMGGQWRERKSEREKERERKPLRDRKGERESGREQLRETGR